MRHRLHAKSGGNNLCSGSFQKAGQANSVWWSLCPRLQWRHFSDDTTQHGDSLENPDEGCTFVRPLSCLSSRTPFPNLSFGRYSSIRGTAGGSEQAATSSGLSSRRGTGDWRQSEVISHTSVQKTVLFSRETEMVFPCGGPRHLPLPANAICSSSSLAVTGWASKKADSWDGV